MVQRSVRTWHHIQKEIVLFWSSPWIPFPTPNSVRKRLLRKLRVPGCLALAKTSRAPAFRRHLPPPCPVSYMMLGSRFMRRTDVSVETTGQVMVHLAARWPELSSLWQGTGWAQRQHSWLVVYSEQFKGTCRKITKCNACDSFIRKKKFAACSLLNMEMFCFLFHKSISCWWICWIPYRSWHNKMT